MGVYKMAENFDFVFTQLKVVNCSGVQGLLSFCLQLKLLLIR